MREYLRSLNIKVKNVKKRNFRKNTEFARSIRFNNTTKSLGGYRWAG